MAKLVNEMNCRLLVGYIVENVFTLQSLTYHFAGGDDLSSRSVFHHTPNSVGVNKTGSSLSVIVI